MRIESFYAEGYRSLFPTKLLLQNYALMIGRNNAGKSNVLQALKILFEGTNRDISEEDFYQHVSGKRIEKIIFEATIKDIENYLPLCAENHRTKIQKCVENDTLRIRRIATLTPLNLNKLEIWQPEQEEFGLPTGIDAALKQLLPEIIFIEAFKDPSEEAHSKGSAVLGKLLKQIVDQVSNQISSDVEDSLIQADKKLNISERDGKVIDERATDLKRIEERIRDYIRKVFESADVRLRFKLPKVPDFMGSGTIESKDRGTWTPPEGKGQGFQRALYLALLQTLAEELRPRQDEIHRPFLLLFEEPEAFLHPSLQREMGDALETISKSNQVVLATHSPLLLKPTRISNVIILRQGPFQGNQHDTTNCYIPNLDLLPDPEDKQLSNLMKFSNSSEFLFSDYVFVVEGPSDRELLEASWNILRLQLPFNFGPVALSIIDAGNKTVVPVWVKCLKAMGFKSYGVVDLDFLWRGAGKCLESNKTLSLFAEVFWSLAKESDIIFEEKNGEHSIPKNKKLDAFKLINDNLKKQKNTIINTLRENHNIWVLNEGEIESYFNLTSSSKGAYSEVSQKIRNGEIPVHDEIKDIFSWPFAVKK